MLNSLLPMLIVALLVPSPLWAQGGSASDGLGNPDSLDDFADIFPNEGPSFEVNDESDSEGFADEAPAPEPAPEPLEPSFADEDEEPVPAPSASPTLTPVPEQGDFEEEEPAFEEPAFIETPVEEYAEPNPIPQAPPAPVEQPVVGTTPYEERFHQIYEGYIKKPVPQEQWSDLVGQRRSEAYTVQSGDTLWDISKTFFDDGGYWPKMWAINSDLTNPHLVSPGYQVEFLAGTLHQSPSLSITEQGAYVPEAAIAAGVEIPPSSVIQPKNREGIPSSFPQYSYLPPPLEERQVEISTVTKTFPPPTIPVTNFVSDMNYYAVATILGAENGSDSAVSFDLILVKSNGPAQVGATFSVIRKLGEESAPTDNGYPSDVRKINRYQAQGVVRIKEVVNSIENIYRAEVLRSFDAVTAGSMLVQEEVEMVNLSHTGTEVPVRGHVIGGHSFTSAKMFGPSSFVFLDAGSNQGVSKGQLVPIYSNPLVRFRDVKALQNQRKIGIAKVAMVTPQFSTAVTLQVSEEVRVGDLTSQASTLVSQGPRALRWVQTIAPTTGEPLVVPEMASSQTFSEGDAELEALTNDFDFEEIPGGDGGEATGQDEFEGFDF